MERKQIISFEGCDCETGLINKIPRSHVKYLDNLKYNLAISSFPSGSKSEKK